MPLRCGSCIGNKKLFSVRWKHKAKNGNVGHGKKLFYMVKLHSHRKYSKKKFQERIPGVIDHLVWLNFPFGPNLYHIKK